MFSKAKPLTNFKQKPTMVEVSMRHFSNEYKQYVVCLLFLERMGGGKKIEIDYSCKTLGLFIRVVHSKIYQVIYSVYLINMPNIKVIA